MNQPVIFDILDTAGPQRLGMATLNQPDTLNGLSLDMCELLQSRLTEWERDPSIALVILRGAGERAFCAGGDLHRVYRSMIDNTGGPAWDNAYARAFFETEYWLDYHIHTYSKLILCWGSGIVMGGGVGLMMGASHRVASETTRFAMPEISIGLFPDVGGTWMLARLPGATGRFLALTGAQLGAADLRFLGLVDHRVASAQWPALLQRMQAGEWAGDCHETSLRLRAILLAMEGGAADEPGPLRRHYELIRQCAEGEDFDAVCARIAALSDHDDPWLRRAGDTFMAGSPGSARIAFDMLRKVRHMSLADVFRLDFIVALRCVAAGDLQEGIRALLVDKDRRPRWNPATTDQATHAWAERFFEPPWPTGLPHPMADLGITH